MWRSQTFYIPGPASDSLLGSADPNGYHQRPTATKTINVSVVVWGFPPNPSVQMADSLPNRLLLQQFIDTISALYFENCDPPSDPARQDWQSYYLASPKIKLKLAGVYFLNDSVAWWSANGAGAQWPSHIEYCSQLAKSMVPQVANTYLMHVTGHWSFTAGLAAAQVPQWNFSESGVHPACVFPGPQNPLWTEGK